MAGNDTTAAAATPATSTTASSSSPAMVSAIAGAALQTAEAVVPGIAPFDPLIELIMTAIIAHHNATGTWPTSAQVHAALPADVAKVRNAWAAWTPSGDGSLPAGA